MVIGIVGGMGSYATISFFKRLVDSFPAEKEWDRPRIMIDNYCTIPSRVRAVLYNEKINELIEGMSRSINNLNYAGADRIIVACNTAHVFLPAVLEKVPAVRNKIMNLIEHSAKECKKRNYKKIKLLASEGTYRSSIYSQMFERYNIEVYNSDDEREIRALMEDVKQNKVDKTSINRFMGLVEKEIKEMDGLVLGCTELPVLYSFLPEDYFYFNIVVDPLQCVLNELKNEFIYES